MSEVELHLIRQRMASGRLAKAGRGEHDRDRRATSTGEKRLVYVHAKSCLTLEPLRTLRPETKGQAGACPDRTRAIPCPAQAVTGSSPMVVYSAGHMVGISLDDLRRSSSLVIALPRVDDCLVPESRTVEGRQP